MSIEENGWQSLEHGLIRIGGGELSGKGGCAFLQFKIEAGVTLPKDISFLTASDGRRMVLASLPLDADTSVDDLIASRRGQYFTLLYRDGGLIVSV